MSTGSRKTQTTPISTNRRRVLLGLGAAAAGCPVAHGFAATPAAADTGHVTDAPIGHIEKHDRVPYHGARQAGIVTPRPAAGIAAAFDVVAQTPEDLDTLFRVLTRRIAFLTQGGPVPELDPRLPPADSGILGPRIAPDNLTITVGVGASLFDNRPWLAPHTPRQLTPMQQFPNDALDAERCHGDLSLQFCANTPDTNIHALRDILKTLSAFLVLRWKQEGNVPEVAPMPDGTRHSARNFLGFRDGSANPDSADATLMEKVVWVGPDNGEPAWAEHGSYQVVRIIRNFVERWDRTPLREQEHIFGRQKASGAPLGGTREFEAFDYANDPEGKIIPLDAHIRLANPRTRASADNLILRRPFNYSNGVTRSGQLEQGLLFIVYQADLEKGFITVQNRLNGEPLEEYIKPTGGGYFFILPGARDDGDYLGRTLIEAVNTASPTPT